MWDSSKISITEVIKRRFSLSIKCLTLCKKVCWITNVYAPCGYRERKLVWLELSSLDACSSGAWCVGGDFNITGWVHERFPFSRSTKGMSLFNKFIDIVNLIEIPLQNGWFTWSREGISPSRSLLDRFFINQEWDVLLENSRVSRKERIFSDHFPLMLEAGTFLWDPSTFWFCNSWLQSNECNQIIIETIYRSNFDGWAGFSLHEQLRSVKMAGKAWYR